MLHVSRKLQKSSQFKLGVLSLYPKHHLEAQKKQERFLFGTRREDRGKIIGMLDHIKAYMKNDRCSTLKETPIDFKDLGLLDDASIFPLHSAFQESFWAASAVLDGPSAGQKQNRLEWCIEAFLELEDSSNHFSKVVLFDEAKFYLGLSGKFKVDKLHFVVSAVQRVLGFNGACAKEKNHAFSNSCDSKT